MIERLNDNRESSYFNHIKTQFAPIEIHIAVIKLLKYIQQKYSSNVEVWDEGGYWQTENYEILKGKLDFLNSAMDQLENQLNSIEFDRNNTTESIADKIEEILKKMNFRRRN